MENANPVRSRDWKRAPGAVNLIDEAYAVLL